MIKLEKQSGGLQADSDSRWKGDDTFTSLGVTIHRRYFDDDEKKWKTAKGFRDSDLLTLAFAAQELYRQLAAEKQK